MSVGQLISLEGGEGVGKTTVFKKLQELAAKNDKFQFYREPGGTDAGEIVRTVLKDPDFCLDPLTQFLLFMGSRVELFEKKIRPALRAGVNVVTDRFDASTFAYQIFEPGRTDLELLFNEVRRVYTRKLVNESDWLKPVYVYFELDPIVGIERIKKEGRGLDVNDQKEISFHERVASGYKAFFDRRLCETIDASQSPESVLSDVLNIIHRKTGIDLNQAPVLI